VSRPKDYCNHFQSETLTLPLSTCRLAAKKAKKKEMPTIDHSEVKYEPFRKAFYVPNDETNALDEDDVDLMRMEMDGIKIRGQDCPKPVRNWGAFGLPAGW
jgi:ATP-dependent RNA helicase DDX46/PRP5